MLAPRDVEAEKIVHAHDLDQSATTATWGFKILPRDADHAGRSWPTKELRKRGHAQIFSRCQHDLLMIEHGNREGLTEVTLWCSAIEIANNNTDSIIHARWIILAAHVSHSD